jgi:UDP-glucuronate 4-epimerase
MRTALVTGVAGFVGMATAARLLADGWRVVGFDNLNDYYDPTLKEARLAHLRGLPQAGNFSFHKLDLADAAGVLKLVVETQPEVVIHLGAQASVRYGLKNQVAYLNSNLIGHFNMLAACKALNEASPGTLKHLLYASSSSVYGGNEKVPFEETDDVSNPQSLYAATKAADELVTHAWVNQFTGSQGAFPASGMRFFTVYGPWGRPDMSPMIFASAILNGTAIPLYNKGDLWRDFTYIDDIVEAIVRLIPALPKGKVAHEVYNLGNQSPVRMDDFVAVMGKVLGKEPVVDLREWPPTEVYKTYASTAKLQAAVGWAPSTSLEAGLSKFVAWYTPRHATIKV